MPPQPQQHRALPQLQVKKIYILQYYNYMYVQCYLFDFNSNLIEKTQQKTFAWTSPMEPSSLIHTIARNSMSAFMEKSSLEPAA